MAGPFADVFLPQLAQGAGAGALGALQGLTQAPFAAEDLTQRQQEAALRALNLMARQQSLPFELLQQQLALKQMQQPQPFHFAQGSVYGTMDPMTGKMTTMGQAPMLAHPLAKEAAEKDIAQAEEARAKAEYYRSGTGPGVTSDQRNATAMGMTLKDFLDYKKGLVEEAKLQPKQLDFMAEQALAGDTTVFQNLGRGLQGAENIVALRRTIEKKAKERGITGAQMAARTAEFMGIKAGERTLGTRTANIEMAVSEAQQMAPLALAASEKVDRTEYPTLNKLLLAAERGTGDENVVRLGIATNSLINIYARAINPTGVPTVSDKEHARELLAMAWSQGQFKSGIDQLMLELSAARQAPGTVRGAFREAVTGGGEAKVGQKNAPKKLTPRVRTDAEYEKLPSGTEFIGPDGKTRRKP